MNQVFFLTLLYCSIVVATVTILNPDDLRSTFIAPSLRSSSNDYQFTIEGELLVPANIDYCSGNVKPEESFSNKIILLDMRGGCQVVQSSLQTYFDSGATGVIFLVTSHGTYTNKRAECASFRPEFKVVFLYYDESDEYLHDLSTSNVTVQIASETTPACSNAIWIPFSLLSGLYSLFCVAYSAHKLAAYIRVKGYSIKSTPQTCLLSGLIGSLLHLIIAIDPENYGIFSPSITIILVATLPFHGLSLVLLAINWDKTISATTNLSGITNNLKFKKYQWLLLALWLLYLICSIILVIIALANGSLNDSVALTDFTDLAIACAIIVGVYYCVTGFRVVKYLTFSTLHRQLRRMTALVGVVTVLLFLMLIFAILNVPQVVGLYSVVGLYIFQFGFLTVTLAQVMAFVTPQKKVPTTEVSLEQGQSTSSNVSNIV